MPVGVPDDCTCCACDFFQKLETDRHLKISNKAMKDAKRKSNMGSSLHINPKLVEWSDILKRNPFGYPGV